MKTIYIYCEGPTEESFINAVLYPYFLGMGIYVCPIVCETRRDANRKYRGGVSRYAKVKNELMILCKSHPHEYVTTMFDYSPFSASVDFGVIAPDGLFYGLNTTTGSFDDAIKVSQRGHYYLAVRNNSSKPVHVYGHVNY